MPAAGLATATGLRGLCCHDHGIRSSSPGEPQVVLTWSHIKRKERLHPPCFFPDLTEEPQVSEKRAKKECKKREHVLV